MKSGLFVLSVGSDPKNLFQSIYNTFQWHYLSGRVIPFLYRSVKRKKDLWQGYVYLLHLGWAKDWI